MSGSLLEKCFDDYVKTMPIGDEIQFSSEYAKRFRAWAVGRDEVFREYKGDGWYGVKFTLISRSRV